jgi:CHAD domain-containing protein
MPAKNTDPSIQFYCAQSILPGLDGIKKKAQNIRRRRNIEDVHDIRVSSRRLRACLNIFTDTFPPKKLKIWQRDIKSVTKAYGKVRDLDVQLDWIERMASAVQDKKLLPGIRRVRLRLRQKRQVGEAEMQQVTRTILESPSLMEMQAWAELVLNAGQADSAPKNQLFQLGYEQIQKRLDEFLFFEVFLFDPSRVAELHQMRITAKRLRYALEIFSNLYQGKIDFALEIARQSQQMLGEIHDADVWITFLPSFIDKEQKRIENFYGSKSPYNRLKPGMAYLLADRRHERERLYTHFLEEWKNWKMKESWLNLRKVIFLTNLEVQNAPSPSPSKPNPETEPPAKS